MNKKLYQLLTLIFLLQMHFIYAQPANDKQCNPHALGMLPSPPPCSVSSGGVLFGTAVVVTGSTIGATNDGLSGAITSCYSTSSPPLKDVWYKFTASESHIEVTIQGAGSTPLNNVYVALYESLEDECVGLMPRHCFSAPGSGPFTFDLGPLAWGVKYYLQVASTSTAGNGTFTISVKSKSICADCMKTSVLQSYPLPVQAAYPPDTTVGFCYSVVGYNEQFGNRFHGVVPLFGSGWDATTLNIISAADSADGMGQWKWFSNISIPGDPNVSGFFYDVGGDNNPTNNLGDHATLPHVWTFCFTIKTQKESFCTAGQDDLSIRFRNFSDGESGSLITPQNCSGDEDYVFDAHMECCTKPLFAIPQPASCDNSPTGQISAFGGTPFSFTGYQYELYNDQGVQIDSTQIVGATQYVHDSLVSGNYYLYVTNNQAGCQTAVNFLVTGPLIYSLQQVGYGCGSACTNSAALVIDAGATQSILWDNGNTSALATNLCPGWHTITIVDTGTVACTIVDSIFITPLPLGDTQFNYGQTVYCTSDVQALISDFPSASGGTFSIVGTSSGAVINPSTGAVNLTGITASTPVIIKYQLGPPCSNFSLDTIQVDLAPPVVSIYAVNHVICVGDTISFNNSSSNIIKWYDGMGTLIHTQNPSTAFAPFGGPATVPGTYQYKLTQIDFSVSSCESDTLPVVITVSPSPVVDAGQSESTCLGFGVTLQASGASTYYWLPDNVLDDPTSPTPVATVNQTTTFTLLGTSTNGCKATDTVTVFIDSVGTCEIIIYNGVTPNADNHNDYWYIDGIANFPDNVVSVFNRWGDKIWDGKGYNNSTVRWEGQAFNGGKVPDGTYFYVIHLKDKIYKGWIELTR